MTNKLRQIARFSEGASTNDGQKIKFRIESRDGQSFDFECFYSELPDLFQYLGFIAEDASKKKTGGKPKPFKRDERLNTAPLPTTQIGVSSADIPGKGLLVVRNYDFDIAFLVSPDQLRALQRDVGHIADVLEAQTKKGR